MEYITARNQKNNIGIIGLSAKVFETITVQALEDNANVRIVKGLGLKNAISCKVVDGRLNVNLDILVKNGNNINQLCDKVQKSVSSAITQLTDISNLAVNINIKGFFK